LKQAESNLKAVIQDSVLTSKGKELAKQMMDQSSLVIAKLFMLMDGFYAELCNTYGTSMAEAWHLGSRALCRFFGNLYAVCGQAKLLSMKKEKTDMIGGAFLWASLHRGCELLSSSLVSAGHHNSPLLALRAGVNL
jgi:hypothetical protein